MIEANIQENLNVIIPECDTNQSVESIHFKGSVDKFISQDELLWRAPTVYENYPFQSVAEYMRNIDTKPQKIRSVSALKKCTIYLIQTILPLLHNKQYNVKETIQFISNRMRAIRSQFYIQSEVCLSTLEIMFRYECIASAYTGSLSEIIVVAKTMYQKYKQNPNEAKLEYLKYILLLSASTKQTNQTIYQFTQFFNNNISDLKQYFHLISSLKDHLFYDYFGFMQICSYLQFCLLLPSLNIMRQRAIKSFAASQLIVVKQQLTNYLLFNNQSQLLEFLQKLGYNIQNNSPKISLKMKLNLFKEYDDEFNVIVCQRKRNKLQTEIILE